MFIILVNAKIGVNNNKVYIDQASVLEMMYDDNDFDIVTAFETIQFWPDTVAGLIEIRRVLKPQGQLMIVNRFPGEESKWNEQLKLRSVDDYKEVLSKAGFNQISWDTKTIKGWVMLNAGDT